jgi:hypothetical protein
LSRLTTRAVWAVRAVGAVGARSIARVVRAARSRPRGAEPSMRHGRMERSHDRGSQRTHRSFDESRGRVTHGPRRLGAARDSESASNPEPLSDNPEPESCFRALEAIQSPGRNRSRPRPAKGTLDPLIRYDPLSKDQRKRNAGSVTRRPPPFGAGYPKKGNARGHVHQVNGTSFSLMKFSHS